MERTLSINADVVAGSDTLLFEVARGLREYRLHPKEMVWSLISPDKIRVRCVVVQDHADELSGLVKTMQKVHGVSEVVIDDPDYAPLVETAPIFTD